MGKNKKPRVSNHNHHDGPKPRGGGSSGGQGKNEKKKMASFSKLNTSLSKPKGKAGRKQLKQQQQRQKQQNAAIVPFEPRDRILLVGEGDFSFASSLATHHGCRSVLATSYDSEQTVHEKYPQAKQNIDRLIAAGHSPSKPLKRKRKSDDDGHHSSSENEDSQKWNGIKGPGEEGASENGNVIDDDKGERRNVASKLLMNNTVGPKVLFSIDAKKLGAGVVGGGKEIRNGFPRPEPRSSRLRSLLPSKEVPRCTEGNRGGAREKPRGGPWDIICFNFPHVGGLSTDVNRQVRSNQELLVSFFKACIPLLSTPDRPTDDRNEGSMSSSEDDDYADDYYDSEGAVEPLAGEKRKRKTPPRTEPGQILITIFEGEPYTLWNVRDLARHAGLRVVRSFKFPWSTYPGYSHARTLGEIAAKDGSGRGGWKGEDRDARTFVFEIKDVGGEGGSLASKSPGKGKARRKRKDGLEDDSSSSDG